MAVFWSAVEVGLDPIRVFALTCVRIVAAVENVGDSIHG